MCSIIAAWFFYKYEFDIEFDVVNGLVLCQGMP